MAIPPYCIGPNTNVTLCSLTEEHIIKIFEIYHSLGLEVAPIVGRSVSAEHIKRNMMQSKELSRTVEITPQPYGRAENKLLFQLKPGDDHLSYLHVRIVPNELKEGNAVRKLCNEFDEIIQRTSLFSKSYQRFN